MPGNSRFLQTTLQTHNLASDTTLNSILTQLETGTNVEITNPVGDPVNVSVVDGDISISEIDGVAVSVDNGISDNGTMRVCIANDNADIGIKNGTAGDIDCNITNASLAVTVGSVNITEWNGNTVSVDNGTGDTGTIRVAIANDNDDIPIKNGAGGDIDVNVTNSSAITVGGDLNIESHQGWEVPVANGTAISGLQRAQRVCIASDNSDLPIKNGTSGDIDVNMTNASIGVVSVGNLATNLAQIAGNTIRVGNGVANDGGGVQRVVIANDQPSVLVYNEIRSDIQSYVDFVELSGNSDLSQNVAAATDANTNFTYSGVKYVDKCIVCVRDAAGMDIGDWGNGITLTNGWRLYSKKTAASSKLYWTDSILENGHMLCTADRYFHTGHGSGDDAVHVVYRFETPIYLDTDGEFGVEFGIDDHSGLSSWNVAVYYHS